MYEWRIQESLQGRTLARILLSLGRGSTSKSAFFSIPKNVGYNLVEALRDPKGKDPAYAAIMQVSSCVQAHDIDVESSLQETIQDYENEIEAGLGSKFSFFCSIAFPVIVVRGRLFECYLNSNNEVDISEIENGVVLVSSKNLGEESRVQPCTSVVRVVTEDHIETLAKEAYQAATTLISQDAAIQELWEYERQKLEKIGIKEPPF